MYDTQRRGEPGGGRGKGRVKMEMGGKAPILYMREKGEEVREHAGN